MQIVSTVSYIRRNFELEIEAKLKFEATKKEEKKVQNIHVKNLPSQQLT